jgi:aminocarboxymuconate-semialdehyde decarboxylase
MDRGGRREEIMGAIDVHTHILPRGWDAFLARHADARWPRIVREEGGGCALLRGTVRDRGLTEHVFDAAVRVEDLDRLGIERQLLSPPPLMFCYWAEPPAATEFCRLHNDAIAGVVAARPSRFLGAAIVPLQAPAAAVGELERAVGMGFRCAEIGSSVDGRDLDDESLFPVWEAAAALDVALFVHPAAPVLGASRLARYDLPLVLGNPLETAVAMTRIIYGGLLDRWPQLRWCFGHGGGAFPYVLGRVDRGWEVMPEGRAAIPRRPSEYAPRLWVDSLTHSARALRFALDTHGPDRVVLGSDYPFRMGVDDPVAALDETPLDAATRWRILETNAQEFLGLGTPAGGAGEGRRDPP